MSNDYPKIIARKQLISSPWMNLIGKEVVTSRDTKAETFYSIQESDYVTAIAQLPDGRIPVVNQYRPAVEAHTWELPAGHVDAGETAESACIRELLEETGFETVELKACGAYFPDTGRLGNRQHVFFAKIQECTPPRPPEPGLELALLSLNELCHWITTGKFNHQIHVGSLFTAILQGHLR